MSKKKEKFNYKPDGSRPTAGIADEDTIYQLSQILDIVDRFNKETDLDVLLQYVLTKIIELAKADRAVIFLRKKGSKLKAELSLNSVGELIDTKNLQLDYSLTEKVFKDGFTYYSELPQKNSKTRNADVHSGQLSVICSPMFIGRKKIGVIYADCADKSLASVDSITYFFDILTGQAATAIERGLLIKKTAAANKKLAKFNKELIKAKEFVENAEKLKTNFLSVLSHEIRTPINILLAYATLIKERLEEKNHESSDDNFSVMEKSGNQIISLMEQVIYISELRIGNIKPSYSRINLNKELMEMIEGKFKNFASKENVIIKYDSQLEDALVFTDQKSFFDGISILLEYTILMNNSGKVMLLLGKDKEGSLSIIITDVIFDTSLIPIPTFLNQIENEMVISPREVETLPVPLKMVQYVCKNLELEFYIYPGNQKNYSFKIRFPKTVNAQGD
ncbi:MAG: GAF domain-containing protein [Bacteroidetes bacterium]|nr:GAF domain-containing protein [Bacteroidota bacterium]MBU1678062.1 GAF domain-containing protein [Bacteroidota bacterium]